MVRATVWERAAGFAFPWRSYNTDSPPQAQQPTLSPFTSGGIGRFVPDGGLPLYNVITRSESNVLPQLVFTIPKCLVQLIILIR